MKCILLWFTFNYFLYKCHRVDNTWRGENCTKIHSGTYDNDDIIVCNHTLEKPTAYGIHTTTVTPTSIQTTTVLTTTSIPTTRMLSTSTKSMKATTSAHPNIHTTSTQVNKVETKKNTAVTTIYPLRDHKNTFVNNNTSYILHETTVTQDMSTLITVIVCIFSSLFCLFMCLVLFGYKQYVSKTVLPVSKKVETISQKSKKKCCKCKRKKDNSVKYAKDNNAKDNSVKDVKVNSVKDAKVNSVKERKIVKREMSSKVKNMSLDDWKEFKTRLNRKNHAVVSSHKRGKRPIPQQKIDISEITGEKRMEAPASKPALPQLPPRFQHTST